jgi:hypothetical protein
MKITLEQHGDKISIETGGDDHSATEFIDYICQLMMCAGYHYESVKQAIYGKAEEYEPYEHDGEAMEAERQEYGLHEWWNSLSEADQLKNVELRKDKERLDWLQSSDLTLHSWEEGDVWGSKGVWTIREFIDEKIKKDL